MKKIAIIGAFIFLTICLTIIGCLSDWKGGEGTLTITLGGDSNGRAVDWPPYFDDPVKFRYPMTYIITIDGPVGTIEEKFSFSEDDLLENVKFTFFVIAGRWNVNIKAYVTDKGKFLYSTGDSNVSIKAGQINSVGIKMNKAYYDIGDYGPGGGKIFHVDPRGFTLYLDKDDKTGIIAYYLEVAPTYYSVPDAGGDIFKWADYGTSLYEKNIDTSEEIGTGRKNTYLIISIDAGAPAANACINYTNNGKDDWFLPSKGEIIVLWENRESVNFRPSSSCTVWSSSQVDNNDTDAHGLNVYSSGIDYSITISTFNKSYDGFVYPIRAF